MPTALLLLRACCLLVANLVSAATVAIDGDVPASGALSAPAYGEQAAKAPPRRSLLVLMRGESFRGRHVAAGSGGGSRQQMCDDESIAAPEEATATHAALFETLATAYDVQVRLHTHPVAGCMGQLAAMYLSLIHI